MTGILEMLKALAEETDPEPGRHRHRGRPGLQVAARSTRRSRSPCGPSPPRSRADGTRRVKVAIDGHARATVVLAPTHPRRRRPQPTSRSPTSGRRPITGDQVYAERWMFHDEAYQGIRELAAPRHRRHRRHASSPGPPPASLLDNAGQLIGIWMGEMVDDDRLALPVSIERIDFFGPHPAPGERLECRVRITELEPQSIRCDLELIGRRGRVGPHRRLERPPLRHRPPGASTCSAGPRSGCSPSRSPAGTCWSARPGSTRRRAT